MIAPSRLVPVSLALTAMAGTPARTDVSAPLPTPTDSREPFVPADVTRENDPRVQALNLQGAYTGATYGPRDARG